MNKKQIEAAKRFELKTGKTIVMVRFNEPWGEIIVTTEDGCDHILED